MFVAMICSIYRRVIIFIVGSGICPTIYLLSYICKFLNIAFDECVRSWTNMGVFVVDVECLFSISK